MLTSNLLERTVETHSFKPILKMILTYEDTHSDYGDTYPQLMLKSHDINAVTAFNTFVVST